MCVTGVFLEPLLAEYIVEQQLQLYSVSRIIEDDTVNRKITILQMNSYIYIYIVSNKICDIMCVSTYDTSYDMKPENNVE